MLVDFKKDGDVSVGNVIAMNTDDKGTVNKPKGRTGEILGLESVTPSKKAGELAEVTCC